MGKVIIKPEVRFKLKALIRVLYDKEYFGFKADSRTYVDKIINSFFQSLVNNIGKPKIRKMERITVNTSTIKKTTYYISFEKENNTI